MIKIIVNKNKDYDHCYQVMGELTQNGKDIKVKLFVYADNDKEAKEKLAKFREVKLFNYNLQTLGDVQRAYKKEFGVDVELDSDELKNYMK